MSALAIHPSTHDSIHGAGVRRPRTCDHRRTGPAVARHLRVVPAAPAVPVAPVRAVPAAAVPAVPRTRPRVQEPVRLRLTARGRRVLIALGFVLSIAIGGTAGVLLDGGTEVPQDVATVVVQPGQSLWVLAAETAAPHQDVREVVDQIRALNDLSGSTVYAGQELQVPAQ